MMGGSISLLRDVYVNIKTVFHALSTLNRQYQSLLHRISSPPGLPVSNPTSSYWLDNPPFPDLVDIQSNIPSQADIVIIGSGITAAAAAKSVLELAGDPTPRVVVLEARQLCSGATGRNGGHIKIVPYDALAALNRRPGTTSELAVELVRFQMRHLEVLREVGAGVPEGEVREVETVDLFLEQEHFKKAKGYVDEARQWLPEWHCMVWEADEAREKFGVNRLIAGAISYKAGALWPYRLVTGIWNDLHKRYPSLIISTHTPVEAITTDPTSSHPYNIRSSRGILKARHVLHATNAFAPSFAPCLRGRLTGALAHMTAQRPGRDFPPLGGKRSWSVIYSPGFDYVTQRPDEDGVAGDLMVGGGFMRSQQQGLDQIGVWDDSRLDAFPAVHIRGIIPTVFNPNWGVDGGLKKSWTGILGFTGDTLPFVGRLPSRKGLESHAESGEWIAAGYNGEGMVWAWLCGTAVGIMILGKENENLDVGIGRPGGRVAEWLPQGLGVDEARLKRADLRNLAGEAM